MVIIEVIIAIMVKQRIDLEIRIIAIKVKDKTSDNLARRIFNFGLIVTNIDDDIMINIGVDILDVTIVEN